MTMNVSDVIAAYLEAIGIQHIFGYPGDPSVEFLEACNRRGMNFVLARREGTAGLMAQAAGMLTGQPGVALSTLGPGSTNLVNAVTNAYLDRTPMLAISGQIDTQRLPTFTHQVVNQEALFGPVSKWASTITPETVGHQLRKSHRIALAPRMGPVHLTTPADVVGAEAIDDEIVLPPTVPYSSGFQCVGSNLSTLAKKIAKARRPLILVGLSAMQQDSGDAITLLAEKIGAAVVSSPMAKGTVNETHPLFAGTLDMACNQVMWSFVNEADIILAIGFDAVELIKPWPVSAEVLHIDIVPNTDQIYFASTELIGPVSASCQLLTDSLESCYQDQSQIVRNHQNELIKAYDSGRVTGSLNPSDVIRVARDTLSSDTIVTTDVGSHKLLVGQGWQCTVSRKLLMSNGLSSMGFSLPAAMTAKLLNPDANVVCFTGDGGLAMVQSELQVASSLKLGLRIVVFIDQSLNRIELKQMARGYQSTGTVIEKTDVMHLAAAMGCDGVVVESESTLHDALNSPISTTPQLIGAVINPAQYQTQF